MHNHFSFHAVISSVMADNDSDKIRTYERLKARQENKYWIDDLEWMLWTRHGSRKLRWYTYPVRSLHACPGRGRKVTTVMKDAMQAAHSPKSVCPTGGIEMRPFDPDDSIYIRPYQTRGVRIIQAFGLLYFPEQCDREFMQDIRKLDWKVVTGKRNGDWYPNWDVWMRVFKNHMPVSLRTTRYTTLNIHN